jgi:hypothetical protein
MQLEKSFLLLFISLRPFFEKLSFLSLENCKNKFKGVFAKHSLR